MQNPIYTRVFLLRCVLAAYLEFSHVWWQQAHASFVLGCLWSIYGHWSSSPTCNLLLYMRSNGNSHSHTKFPHVTSYRIMSCIPSNSARCMQSCRDQMQRGLNVLSSSVRGRRLGWTGNRQNVTSVCLHTCPLPTSSNCLPTNNSEFQHGILEPMRARRT